MNFNIHPAGVSSTTADNSLNPPKPVPSVPKVEGSEEERESDEKAAEPPSILNPERAAIQASRQAETEQKVHSLLETSETIGILGSTVDLRV